MCVYSGMVVLFTNLNPKPCPPPLFPQWNHASVVYMCVYSGMVVLFINLLLARDLIFSVWHIIAGKKLHDRLFLRVLKAPILFFLR